MAHSGRFVVILSAGRAPFPCPPGSRQAGHCYNANYQTDSAVSRTVLSFHTGDAATIFLRAHPELLAKRYPAAAEALAAADDESLAVFLGLNPSRSIANTSAYSRPILESVPGSRVEDTHQIEEVMRCTYSTLDHLDRHTFIREARASWLAVQALRQDGTYSTPYYVSAEETHEEAAAKT